MQPTGLAPGTDLAALADSMRGDLIAPADPHYDEARAIWNGMIDRRPAAIARVSGTADVIDAVAHARDNGLLVSIRGGGHNVAGSAMNDGGLVIDMSAMRAVRVDPARRTVWAQAGANWGDVDRETQLYGLATPGGVVSDTGIAGLTLTGGYSSQRRAHGMTIDNLVSAEVVLADGRVVRASEDENEDLFWALRGGGGNFGVVTAFEYRLHELGPEIFDALITFPVDKAGEILDAYRDYVATAPNEVTADFVVWALPEVEDLPPELRGKPFAGVAATYAGPVEDGEHAIAPIRDWAEPLVDMSGPTTYLEMQVQLDPLIPKGGLYYWKSLYMDGLDDHLAGRIAERAQERPSVKTIVILRHLGGAIRDVPADATAFADRDAEFLLSVDSCWTDPADSDVNIAYTRDFYDEVVERTGARTYFNFASDLLDHDESVLRQTYGDNYERLVDVKTKYDPGNLFRVNQNIRPRTA